MIPALERAAEERADSGWPMLSRRSEFTTFALSRKSIISNSDSLESEELKIGRGCRFSGEECRAVSKKIMESSVSLSSSWLVSAIVIVPFLGVTVTDLFIVSYRESSSSEIVISSVFSMVGELRSTTRYSENGFLLGCGEMCFPFGVLGNFLSFGIDLRG